MILAVTIFTIVANLGLAIAVFLRNTKSVTHRLFGMYAILVSIWAITNYFSIIPTSAEEMLWYIRLVLSTTCLMTPVLYVLAHTFPDTQFRLSERRLIVLALFTFATAILALTPLGFETIQIVDGVTITVPGKGIIFLALNLLGIPIVTFWVLLKRYRTSGGRLKQHLYLFMWGQALTFLLAEITNFILPVVFHAPKFVILGPLLTLILVAFLFYAITKYRLLDVQALIFRSVTFMVVTAVLIGLYIAGVGFLFRNIGILRTTSLENYWGIVAIGLVISIGIVPLYRFVQRYLGKYFFRYTYKPEALVFKMMQTLSSEVDFDIVGPRSLDLLTNSVGITKAAIALIDDHKITQVTEHGYPDAWFTSEEDRRVIEDVFHQETVESVLVLDDLTNESFKEVFRALDIQLIFPIKKEDREIGFLICGGKSTGESYTERDLNVLKIIAGQIGDTVEGTRKFRMLKIVDVIKSDFVNSVSHEFRTPLTESRWRLEMMLSPDYKNPVNPDLKKDLTSIYDSVRWLVESLNELTTTFDLEVKSTPTTFALVDVPALITDDVFTAVKEIAFQKKVTLNTNIPVSIPRIQGDAQKLKQAFQTLLENAVKYSHDGSEVLVTISMRHTKDQQSFLCIEIKDFGIGIKKEDIPNIFSKFFRGETARHAKPNGLGLGMYITKKVVELHNGKIWVESYENVGSTFHIELPYK